MNRPLLGVINDADFIARGITSDSYSDWDKSGKKNIYTYTPLTISEMIKGKINTRSILLRQPGGSKDGMEMHVPGSATFEHGQDVVVLLGKYNEEDQSYELPGLATGKYEVKKDSDGIETLVNSLASEMVYTPKQSPNDHAKHSYSNASQISLDVFKKIAQGQNHPRAEEKQFTSAVEKQSNTEVKNPTAEIKAETQTATAVENTESKTATWFMPAIGILFAVLISIFIWKLF